MIIRRKKASSVWNIRKSILALHLVGSKVGGIQNTSLKAACIDDGLASDDGGLSFSSPRTKLSWCYNLEGHWFKMAFMWCSSRPFCLKARPKLQFCKNWEAALEESTLLGRFDHCAVWSASSSEMFLFETHSQSSCSKYKKGAILECRTIF